MEVDNSSMNFHIQGDGITASAIIGKERAYFVGVATTNKFTQTLVENTGVHDDLYIRAINNRTRERNYFKLYSSLLRGDISDDEFDKEIEDNEDDYVVPAGLDASLSDIEFALQIAPKLKNVKTTDDFMSLFSFNDQSIQKYVSEKDQ